MAAVLLPTVPALSAKAVCANTARLLDGLRAPAVAAELGADPDLIVRLLLDSVIEIEHGGGFASGAAVVERLELAAVGDAADTAPARLSLEALRYGERLALDHGPGLSARLYYYNRVPISPRWTARLGTPDAVAAWWGIDGGPLRARMDRDWVDAPPLPDNPGWYRFRSRTWPSGAPFKLYVSPRVEHAREALAAAAGVLAAHGFASFKLGRDVSGVLRPDKLVAYAASREQIEAAAEHLLRELRGLPAQAVPFTAGIDADGLVSWGIDPPRTEQVSTWQGTSWRRWITDRLAVALITARASGAQCPSELARQRLALEGVDVASWAPAELAWTEARS
jgi:hypothetical protein